MGFKQTFMEQICQTWIAGVHSEVGAAVGVEQGSNGSIWMASVTYVSFILFPHQVSWMCAFCSSEAGGIATRWTSVSKRAIGCVSPCFSFLSTFFSGDRDLGPNSYPSLRLVNQMQGYRASGDPDGVICSEETSGFRSILTSGRLVSMEGSGLWGSFIFTQNALICGSHSLVSDLEIVLIHLFGNACF